MFVAGDTVLYGSEGVCRLEGSMKREVGGKTREYYVLKPVYRKDSTVFVPKENEQLTGKMKRILSREETEQLLEEIPGEEALWIAEESERKARFSEILAGGDRRELVRVIKGLYLWKRKQEREGKKFHISDERFLKEAQERLHGELALVLGIQPDQVGAFISQRVRKQEEEQKAENGT